MNTKKGFTIIELIVVIAIIAVLAGIVMVNVTQYIAKGKDAAIKGNLSTLLTNGAVWAETSNDYTNFVASTTVGCGAGSPVVTAVTAASSSLFCSATATTGAKWVGCAVLKSDSTNAFCVDSSGAKTTVVATDCTSANVTGKDACSGL